MAQIAVLHPGEMGAAVARVLVANGQRVHWAAEGVPPPPANAPKRPGYSQVTTWFP